MNTKVGIIIICYNISSEIFMLQIEAIKKFCKDENYEIIIFDNSSDVIASEGIEYHSGQFNLSYIKTYANSENGSDSHSFAANLSYQKVKDVFDFLLYLDHDCIPVCDFSVEQILNGNVLAGVGQGAKKKYMWPGCLFINNNLIDKDIIDFSPSHKYNLDSGGNLYVAIEKYGADNCIFFNEAYFQNPYFVDNKYGFYNMINNQMFMHFVGSSNWEKLERHEERINSLLNVAREKTGL